MRTFAQQRIKILLAKFQMHQMLNRTIEIIELKKIYKMDFYNIKKIDNHIHHSAAMSASHLRKFIMKKYYEEAET
jgi:AMP deaminase